MYYDQKNYKFYKPISAEQNKANIKQMIIDFLLIILAIIGIVILLTGAFWLDALNPNVIAAGFGMLIPQPSSWMNPPEFFEDDEEFECLECGKISNSEICSQDCHDAYMM